MAFLALHRLPKRFSIVTVLLLPGILFAGTPPKSTTINPDALSTEIPIREWSILGPYRYMPADIGAETRNRDAGGLNHDFLRDLGHAEDSIDAETFEKIARFAFTNRSAGRQSSLVPLDRLFPNREYSVAYAACQIISTSDADVGIATGSDDGQKLWLNGKLLIATPNIYKSAAEQYDRLAVAHLKQGKNFLLVKVDQKTAGWRFFFSIMPLPVMDKLAFDTVSSRDNRILNNKFINVGQEVSLTPPYARQAYPLTVVLTDRSGKQVFSADAQYSPTLAVSLPNSIAEGFYHLSVDGRTHAGAFTVHDSLYIGDPDVLYRQLAARRNALAPASPEYLSLNVLAKRYEVLNLPQYKDPEDHNWQNKVLLVLHEAAMAMNSPNSLGWTKASGIHLREFVSAIDGQPQDYALVLPEGAHGPLPLIVSFPAFYDTPLPFVSGPRLTYFHEIDLLHRTASQIGAAIVLFYGRGNTFGAPIGEADALEVLEDVTKNFEIDRNRIYAYGECAGAQRALVTAAHYPSLFAAVGTYDLGVRGPVATAIYPGTRSDIRSLATNLTNTPVLLLNGEDDVDSPLPEAQLFSSQLKQAGVPVDFEVLPGGEHVDDRAATALISYLIRQKRERTPNLVHLRASHSAHGKAFWVRIRGSIDPTVPMEVDARHDSGRFFLTTKNTKLIEIDPGQLGIQPGTQIAVECNGSSSRVTYGGAPILINPDSAMQVRRIQPEAVDGPINEVFASAFMVVVGTRFSASRETVLAFARRWKEDFFTDCRVKTDVDVTMKDIHSYNLVLIGEPSPKSLLAGAIAQFPVQKRDGMLTIAGRSHRDSGLQYVVSRPDPLDPSHYLLLVNSRPERWKSRGSSLALAGTYNYAVWDEHGVTLDSGHSWPEGR